MIKKRKKLLVMAGGTGGHIFPAIAVAQYLQQQEWDICWLGTEDRMEAQLVPKYNIPIDFIQISGVRGKGILALLKAPFAIFRALIQAYKIIKKQAPNAVLGMGGYVSGPGGIAAKLCGVPVILHEQNAVAGITNVFLAKIATSVLQAFPTAFPNAEVVGNPIRQDLFAMPSPQERYSNRTGKLRLLVIGGSQGARILNNTIPNVVMQLTDKLIVHHQVGKGEVENVASLYPPDADVKVSEFINNMAEAYAWADIVICRAGAITVCELAAVGVPAIFIPFQHKDQQQYLNAKYLADVDAAKIVQQSELNADILVDILRRLDREKLLNMAINAKKMASPLATQRVSAIIITNAN